MKIKLIITLILCLNVLNIFAQTNNNKELVETIEIKTSANCGMCKTTIEKNLKNEEGIIKSKLNIRTKVVKVKYHPEKINPEKIRKQIALSGYDADNISADSVAYNKLHDCCKKRKKVQ